MDRDALNHRVLRAERLARLEELQQPGEGDAALEGQKLLTSVPGGGDDPNASLNAAQGASLVPFRSGGKIAAGAIPDGPALAAVTTAGGSAAEAALLDAAPAERLHLARSCYICKRPYRELHAFYAQVRLAAHGCTWLLMASGDSLEGFRWLLVGAGDF